MALFAFKSWIKYVQTQRNLTLAFIMKLIVIKPSDALSNFWNLRDILSQQIFKTHLLRLDLTHSTHTLSQTGGFIVGVSTVLNCKDSIHSDIVTKKNTQTSNLGVLRAKRSYRDYVIPILAFSLINFNSYARCYV